MRRLRAKWSRHLRPHGIKTSIQYCPEGTLYLLNSNYLSLYIHEQGSFVFTGFESRLPNWQIGYVGAVLTIAELVSTKPKSMTKVTGLNSLTL